MNNKKNLDEQFICWFESSTNRELFVDSLNYLKHVDKKFINVKDEKKCLYLPDSDFLEWIKVVLNDTNFASFDSYRDLLEFRGGQYSNATLYSSSRMALELFRDRLFAKSMLLECFKDNESILGLIKKNDFKIHLEKLLPIHLYNDGKKVSTNSHMDVFIEISNVAVLAIECKMKEIYTIESNTFTESYKTILKTIGNSKNFKCNNTTLEHIVNDDIHETRFYFKQQVCHLLGLYEYKLENNKIVKFANFVFNPCTLMNNADFNEAYNSYIVDASTDGIIKDLQEAYPDFGKIKYCGVFSQENKDGKLIAQLKK